MSTTNFEKSCGPKLKFLQPNGSLKGTVWNQLTNLTWKNHRIKVCGKMWVEFWLIQMKKNPCTDTDETFPQ